MCENKKTKETAISNPRTDSEKNNFEHTHLSFNFFVLYIAVLVLLFYFAKSVPRFLVVNNF